MKDKLLYFPYINVPYNAWVVRNLIYWDEIGAIVPRDYINEPNRLEREMREMVSAQLIRQVIPDNYIYKNENRFANAFIELIKKYKIPERTKNSKFGAEYSSKIHVDKFGYQIIEFLKENNLAKQIDYPWYIIETVTANLFMAYLAAYLANEDDLDMTPMTDAAAKLAVFAEDYPIGALRELSYLENMRLELLNDFFPMPSTTIRINEIISFKERYGEFSKNFRQELESKIKEISFIESKEERSWKLNELKRTSADKIKELESRMKERNWGKILFGTLCGLGSAAIPGVRAIVTHDISGAIEAVPGLLGAIYSVYEGRSDKQKAIIESPLAYASYVKKTFK